MYFSVSRLICVWLLGREAMDASWYMDESWCADESYDHETLDGWVWGMGGGMGGWVGWREDGMTGWRDGGMAG